MSKYGVNRASKSWREESLNVADAREVAGSIFDGAFARPKKRVKENRHDSRKGDATEPLRNTAGDLGEFDSEGSLPERESEHKPQVLPHLF